MRVALWNFKEMAAQLFGNKQSYSSSKKCIPPKVQKCLQNLQLWCVGGTPCVERCADFQKDCNMCIIYASSVGSVYSKICVTLLYAIRPHVPL